MNLKTPYLVLTFIEQRSLHLQSDFFHFFKERPSKSSSFFSANLPKPLPISITKITPMGVRPSGSSSDDNRRGRVDHLN